MDINAFRARFPAVLQRTYLNTAGGGAMSDRAAAAGRMYYEEAETLADVAWNTWLERSEQVRERVARFIGAAASEISFLQNTSLGINIVSRLFDEKIEVLALDKEFPSCTIPWLRVGHELRFMSSPNDGRVFADDVARAMNSNTGVFVLSSVQFANGFRANLREIGKICRDAGVFFVVDATQSVCAYDIDVERDAIDALVFSGYKWATAGYGIAALYLARDRFLSEPPLVGWRSAARPYLLENDRLDLARHGIGYEMGHPTFPGIFALGAALALFEQVGMDRVSARIDDLVHKLRARLAPDGFNIVSNGESGSTSGILLVELENADEWAAALKKRDVWVTARRSGLRVSAHAYNNEADLDRLMHAMSEIRSEKG